MNDESKIFLADMGMITPLGENTEKTAAAVRAGVSQLKESDYYSKAGKPINMSLVPEEVFPEITYKLNREEGTTFQMGVMLMMTDIALKQVMQNYSGDAPVPLFFSGPEAYQNGPYSVTQRFIEYITTQTSANIDMYNSRLFATGRTGVIDAVDLAIRYLQQTDAEYILVGGADSYQDDETLDFLDADDRVMSEGVMNGFVPGEAAGFLLLTNDVNKAMRHNSGVVSLSEPGLALEEGHMYSHEPYKGEGCSAAFKQALNGYNGKKIAKIYSSINGEQFWAKEYGVALNRNKSNFTNDVTLEHPADCLGDIGAAAGAILISLAANSLFNKCVDDTFLVACSSDQSYRAAICVNFEQL
ncbi:MAG: hypothetical protein KJO91_09220 [Gammaproteobacteria bacterium]|nr:hypothetical protein [Gammaproteobacteria bacterium]